MKVRKYLVTGYLNVSAHCEEDAYETALELAREMGLVEPFITVMPVNEV